MSRRSPVHTAMRNLRRDEGGPFEVDNQVADPSTGLLWPKAMVVSVAENVETRFRQAWLREANASEPSVQKCRKLLRRCKTGG